MEEQQKNRITNYVGIALIFVLMFLWMKYALPDSSATNNPTATTNANPADTTQQQNAANPQQAVAQAPAKAAPAPTLPDSLLQTQAVARLGVFAPAGSGTAKDIILENELVRITFNTKGGRIKDVLVKNFEKVNVDAQQNDVSAPLRLLEDEKNRFDYTLMAANAAAPVNTSELYHSVEQNGNTVTFKAPTSTGGYFEQTYTLQPNSYQIDYRIGANNLQSALVTNQLQLTVENYLDKMERNQNYERTMSTVYYKVSEENYDYCDCRTNDQKSLGGQPVKWFAHSNQFFNTSFVANDFNFTNFVGETEVYDDFQPDLKRLKTTATIPLNLNGGVATMTIYSGPNEFKRLASYNQSLEDIIPFGSSILGTINRYVIYPVFDFLLWIIGSQGIVILALTLLVKLILFPLTYRMVLSQSKMAALKPKIDALRKKFGDDKQAMSAETMKLYSEHGVNPLGGCLPVLLQMPIWLALYRFFPSAIEFRQASFLWATDLSSYDVAFKLPTAIYGFGNHVSLFTIIWVITTLGYTWYTMKQMDNATMDPDQARIMKYMQYAMPVMFMFFFNTFAAGLTCYLCFSNLLNVGQTVLTKEFLIDKEKIAAQLEANRNKPKNENSFRARLERAVDEQKKVQEEQRKKKDKK
jgi:YidC/Oxa1 family membrane protein insertase